MQKAGPSGGSSASDHILWMIVCKRPDPPDDYLQEATTTTGVTSGVTMVTGVTGPKEEKREKEKEEKEEKKFLHTGGRINQR